MRAWQVTGRGEPREVMRVASAELPPDALGQGALKIRVRGAALGFPDVLMCRGIYPLTPPLPFTPGQEFFGEERLAGFITAEADLPTDAFADALLSKLAAWSGSAPSSQQTDDITLVVVDIC